MMWADTGLEIKKKSVITSIFPVTAEMPESIIAAINTDITEVVLHVDEA